MKAIQLIIAALAIVATAAVFFCVGRNYEAYYYNYDDLFEKHQQLRADYDKILEDNSRMSDVIRLTSDALDENKTIDSDFFEEVCYNFLEDSVKLNDYVWAY